jgi:hypothetical protein
VVITLAAVAVAEAHNLEVFHQVLVAQVVVVVALQLQTEILELQTQEAVAAVLDTALLVKLLVAVQAVLVSL